MRKVIFVLAFLFAASTAYAGLIFTPAINPDGTATVTWTSDQGVVGMVLWCTVTSGGEDLIVEMNDFNVLLHEDPFGIPGEIPGSNIDYHGTVEPGQSFYIGGGYQVNGGPGLFTGTIGFEADVYTTINIIADEARGGVLSIDNTQLPFTPFEVIILPEPMAMVLLGAGGFLAVIRKKVS